MEELPEEEYQQVDEIIEGNRKYQKFKKQIERMQTIMKKTNDQSHQELLEINPNDEYSETKLEEIKKLPTFKIGINGVVTFKNSKLSEVIRQTDLEKILLETDAPYLSPVPYRGRRNEPTYIWKTAEKVAETFGLTLEETVNATRKNTLELFKSLNKPI